MKKKTYILVASIVGAVVLIMILFALPGSVSDEVDSGKEESAYIPEETEEPLPEEDYPSGMEDNEEGMIDSTEGAEESRQPLEGFSYQITDGELLLDAYQGEESVLQIYPYYEIEGVKYLSNLEQFVIKSKSVQELVLDEGIKKINKDIFRGSNSIQKISFPSSMQEVYDYMLASLKPGKDVKIQIDYPGNEEEWNNIFKRYEPDSFENAIAQRDIRKTGNVALDKLKDASNAEYDSSRFEFYFNGQASDGKILPEHKEDYMDAKTPSYEELLRYPDEYRTEKIIINAVIKDTNKDGDLVGGILGEYEGKEIWISDDRIDKQPRLLAGDKVILYGYGNGNKTVRRRKGIKIEEKYEIPKMKTHLIEIK